MWQGITLIAGNLGVSWEIIFLIILNLGLIIFMAKDVRLAFILMFLVNSVLFVIFHERSLDFRIPLVLMLISFVLMALSLLFKESITTNRIT